MSLVFAIGVAIVLFVTTNLDDLFVLVAFFADPRLRARQVVIGQFVGIAALVGVSLAGSLLALVASPRYLGLLGLVPFAIGAIGLVEIVRGSQDDDDNAIIRGSRHGTLAVALVTIANGGDNVGAYVPVFATRTPIELAATVAVFFALAAAWCALAHGLVNHPRIGPIVTRVARPATPIVLMLLGVVILVEAESFRLVIGD